MAIVKDPLYSSDARGTIGGVTFSKSFAGNIAKIHPVPPRRARTTQPGNRHLLAWLARFWGELSDSARVSWKTWALNHPEPDKFGGTFIMSGINAFVKLNHTAMRIFGSSAQMTLPPADPPAASVATLAAVAGAVDPGDVDLTVTVTGSGSAEDKIEFQIAGPFQSPGLVEVFNQFRYVDSIVGNLLVDTISDLDEGFWYWFRARYVDEFGQVTPWIYAQATPKVTV